METPYVLTVKVKEAKAQSAISKPPLHAVDAILQWGVFVLLALAVLAFGTTEAWSLFMLESGAVVLFFIWAFRQMLAGSLNLSNPAYVPVVIFAAIVAAQWLFGLSSSPYSTHTEVWKYVAYGMLFLVVDSSFRSRESQRTFLMALSLFGFLVALFAIAQNSAGNEKIYWLRTTQWKNFFGPYVNRNHYAGLMEMLAPISLAFCFSRRLDFWKKTLFGLFSIVMGTTVFLSGSRGGMAAFSLEILFFAILLARSVGWRRTIPGIAIFLLLAVAGLTWLDVNDAVIRMGSLQHPLGQEVAGARVAILQDGLKMIARHPVLGWGLGAFPDVYPQFRSFYTDLFINEAHNDYLQIFVETGVLGFVAVLAFLFLFYRNGFRGLYERGQNINPVKLGVLAGCTGLLVHSFTDFNLHIPANAALFYSLCALAGASDGQSAQTYVTQSGKIRRMD